MSGRAAFAHNHATGKGILRGGVVDMITDGTRTAEQDVPIASGGRETVAVLLSVYNGAPYLREQLISLCAQSHTDWVVLWRDDGSRDDSRALMARFAAEVGPERCREWRSGARLGVTGSFLTLLRAAEGYPYVAFADQDDVWLPGKLARAIDWLTGEGARLGLYCARQRLVDHRLSPIGYSPAYPNPPRFPAALAQNIATGCTVVLNRKAADRIAESDPPAASVHDWWSYLVVSALGGRVLFDEEPQVLYRQHAGNAIGAAPPIWHAAQRAVQRGPLPFFALLEAHMTALERSVPGLPETTIRTLAEIRAGLNGDLLSRCRLVRRGLLRRRTVPENALLLAWMAMKPAARCE